MTATDELRALLDECGVEWKGADPDPRYTTPQCDTKTEWNYGGGVASYREWPNGTVRFTAGKKLTPQQAIDATLGHGECRSDETETIECVTDYGSKVTIHVMECSACGHTYEHVYGSYEYCPHCRARIEGE